MARVQVRNGVALLAIAVVSGFVSWLAMGDDRRSRSTAAVTSPPAHATWIRHESLSELMASSTLVVSGTVVDVADYPPITWRDAGSAPGAPAIPRELVTVRIESRLFGDEVGDTVKVVHALAPKPAAFLEDRPFEPTERVMLFLRKAVNPDGRASQGDNYNIVGIDGRYRVDRSGAVKGMLPDGLAAQAQRGLDNPARLEEASR